MTITVSAKGQMVIPAPLRKKYHIGAQTRVELLDTGGEIVIIPIPVQPFKSARGTLSGISSRHLIQERKTDRTKEHGR